MSTAKRPPGGKAAPGRKPAGGGEGRRQAPRDARDGDAKLGRAPGRGASSAAPARGSNAAGPARKGAAPARKPAGRSGGSGPARPPSRSRDEYPTVQAFIAIGANLGDAAAAVRAAILAIGAIERTTVTASSSLYRSAPVDATGPDFINAVVAVRTGLTAEALLADLQLLELEAGRERPFPNAPRTLDLDLLTHGNTVKDTPALTLPHPRMRERAFVLKPLAEIAPDKVPRAALARVSKQVIERLRDTDASA
jgi:2-amino-4-hydroxy-6-hydroxymethyldihydropteridine diphosphokinase